LQTYRLNGKARKTIGLAVTSALVFSAIALLVEFWAPLGTMDGAISQWTQGLRSNLLDAIMIVATSMADARVLVITDVLIVLLIFATAHRRLALASAFLLVGCAGLVQGIKWLTYRSRPIADLYGGLSAFSFPSGHAANGAAMLLVLLWLAHHTLAPPMRRAIVAILLALALLIGGSRIYLLAHWPSDVVAGLCLALFAAALSSLVLNGHSHRLHPGIFWLAFACWGTVGGAYTVLRLNQSLDSGRNCHQVESSDSSVSSSTS